MNQLPMFDLNTIPQAEPEAAKPVSKTRWYISARHNGKELILVATHNNGGTDWREVGTFKHQPHLYKSASGAHRMAVSYVKPGVYVTVKEWKGW